MVETFTSDWVIFRIPPNIDVGAPLGNHAMALTIDCFHKETPSQTSDRIPNADLTGGAMNVGSGWTASTWNS